MAKKKKLNNAAGLFIPVGLFIGFGIGFLIDNIPAGILAGIGVGFLLSAIYGMKKQLGHFEYLFGFS